eukprot:6181675-Pleurochrysis_carterae.AAC.2
MSMLRRSSTLPSRRRSTFSTARSRRALRPWGLAPASTSRLCLSRYPCATFPLCVHRLITCYHLLMSAASRWCRPSPASQKRTRPSIRARLAHAAAASEDLLLVQALVNDSYSTLCISTPCIKAQLLASPAFSTRSHDQFSAIVLSSAHMVAAPAFSLRETLFYCCVGSSPSLQLVDAIACAALVRACAALVRASPC